MQYRSVLYIKGDIKCEILNIGVEKKDLFVVNFAPMHISIRLPTTQVWKLMHRNSNRGSL